MSIQDVINQFKDEVGDTVKVSQITMKYSDGGKIQTYSFRVTKDGGAATTIEVECREFTDIPSIVKLAAERAKTWAASNE